MRKVASQRPARGALLAVDQTGVGRPVVDMLRLHVPLTILPITITGGSEVTLTESGWHVPKQSLVSNVVVLMQSDRLKIAPGLPEVGTLVKELQNFKVRITAAGHETFGAWREDQHDDLVLAVALAAWLGEQIGPPVGPPKERLVTRLVAW